MNFWQRKWYEREGNKTSSMPRRGIKDEFRKHPRDSRKAQRPSEVHVGKDPTFLTCRSKSTRKMISLSIIILGYSPSDNGTTAGVIARCNYSTKPPLLAYARERGEHGLVSASKLWTTKISSSLGPMVTRTLSSGQGERTGRVHWWSSTSLGSDQTRQRTPPHRKQHLTFARNLRKTRITTSHRLFPIGATLTTNSQLPNTTGGTGDE